MIVTAERSGGFAGWHERLGPVDTAVVVTGEQIVQAVTDADFFNLAADYPADNTVHDGYAYKLTVENDQDSTHAVSWKTGSKRPDGLRRVLEATERAAGWERVP